MSISGDQLLLQQTLQDMKARNRSMNSVQLESRCQHAQICTFEWLLLDCSITASWGYLQNEPSAVEKTVPRKRHAENDTRYKRLPSQRERATSARNPSAYACGVVDSVNPLRRFSIGHTEIQEIRRDPGATRPQSNTCS